MGIFALEGGLDIGRQLVEVVGHREGLAGVLAEDAWMPVPEQGHDPGDGPSGSRDHDLLAGLHPFQDRREQCPGFVDVVLLHRPVILVHRTNVREARHQRPVRPCSIAVIQAWIAAMCSSCGTVTAAGGMSIAPRMLTNALLSGSPGLYQQQPIRLGIGRMNGGEQAQLTKLQSKGALWPTKEGFVRGFVRARTQAVSASQKARWERPSAASLPWSRPWIAAARASKRGAPGGRVGDEAGLVLLELDGAAAGSEGAK